VVFDNVGRNSWQCWLVWCSLVPLGILSVGMLEMYLSLKLVKDWVLVVLIWPELFE